MSNYMLVGRLADGSTVYYSGRAGKAFVSPDLKEAFKYDSLEAARRKATTFNKYTELHGVRFHVPCGEQYFPAFDNPYHHEELVARGQVQPVAEEIYMAMIGYPERAL